MKIKDITGQLVEVTNLNKAIKQCQLCKDSHFLMDSGYTVGENYTFMLRQLEKLKRKSKGKRRDKVLAVFFSHEPDADEKKQKTVTVK